MPRAMRKIRGSVILVLPAALILLPAQLAFAAEAAAKAKGKGICAPWHRCLAIGGLGITVAMIGIISLGYLIQRRGFDSLEHRQGNPEGVPTDKP